MKHTMENLPYIYHLLQTNPDIGLTDERVKEIQKEKGLNVFKEGKKTLNCFIRE